eukprot:1499228-Rhodomonas_salina.3
MAGILAEAREKRSQPPGVRAFNELVKVAQVEARRGEWLSSAMAFHVRMRSWFIKCDSIPCPAVQHSMQRCCSPWNDAAFPAPASSRS